jgi:ribosomal protein S18 acetylase RimI-like enzyme
MLEGPRPVRHADIGGVRELFREYSRSLDVDLCFQNFEAELRSLPGDYAPPTGALFVCGPSDGLAACVAIHRWSDDAAEMKRLYVRPAARGRGLGEALTRAALGWAKAAGYRRVVLDTLPSMAAAQQLYERLGFVTTEPYRPNPVPGARYMQRVL